MKKGIEIGNGSSIIEKVYNCGEHRDGIAVHRYLVDGSPVNRVSPFLIVRCSDWPGRDTSVSR